MFEISRNIELFEILAALAVWLIPIALDISFRQNSLRFLRVGSWTIAVFCIFLYYLQPFQEVSRPKQDFIIIGKEAKLDMDSIKTANIEVLPDSGYFQTLLESNIGTLHLYQKNLTPWELEALAFDSLNHTPVPVFGITEIHVPNRLYANQPSAIRLEINTTDSLSLQLRLADEIVDKTEVAAGENQLTLAIKPKTSGRFTYQIIGISAGIGQADTVIQETLAVQVDETQKPSILMVASNPSFETKFLKNHLTDLGFELNVRNRISQNSYSKEFINTPKRSVSSITAALLDDTDMIVLDAGAYLKLSNREKSLIRKRNKANSLGVLFLDTDPKAIRDLANASITEPKETTQNLMGFGEITTQTTWSDLLTKIDLSEATLGYHLPHGLGKVGMVAAANLYQIKLGGEDELYSEIWKRLTQDIIPDEQTNRYFEISDLISINERTDVAFITSSSEPTLYYLSSKIPIIESLTRPKYYSGTFWPTKEGWNRLTIMPDSVVKDFYVYGKLDWEAVNDTQENNFQKLYQQKTSKIERLTPTQKIFLPDWIYFSVFLLCMGLLWAEQRFINPN